VATFGRRFIRKWVAPILIFSVPKGMFDCLATLAHSLRVLVEALLDDFQYMLMLPPGKAPPASSARYRAR
jgi:hypothetical protein